MLKICGSHCRFYAIINECNQLTSRLLLKELLTKHYFCRIKVSLSSQRRRAAAAAAGANRDRRYRERSLQVVGVPGKLMTPTGRRSCDQLLGNEPCALCSLARYLHLFSVFFHHTRSVLV